MEIFREAMRRDTNAHELLVFLVRFVVAFVAGEIFATFARVDETLAVVSIVIVAVTACTRLVKGKSV